MSGQSSYQPKGAIGRFVHTLEETVIAFVLGAMTRRMLRKIGRTSSMMASLSFPVMIPLSRSLRHELSMSSLRNIPLGKPPP